MDPELFSSEIIAVICESTTADEVVNRLRQAGSEHFTVVHGALGVGETGRHEGTAIWPGQNSIVLCCVQPDMVDQIVRLLKELHDSRPDHSLGLRVFSLPARSLL